MAVQDFHDSNDPEGFPYLLVQGNLANLSALRGTDAETRAAFFDGRNTNTVALQASAPACLLDAPIAIRLQVGTSGGPDFGDDFDEDENDSPEQGAEHPPAEEEIEGTNTTEQVKCGEIFITNTQVLFVAESDADSDMAIGGTCVILHAMTEDPEPSVYLQIQPEGDHTGPLELTLTPSNTSSSEEECQKLFEALCKLISLHPIKDEDDEDNHGMFSGGMIGGGFGDDPCLDYGEMVWADPTPQESDREAMLERLDNLLVVPPGLEVQSEIEDDDDDGRFDDAVE